MSQSYGEVDTSRFNFVTISIDRKEQDWQRASKADSIPWLNYIDAKGSEGIIKNRFNLDYIPQSLLVNRKGEILEKNLSIEQLLNFCREKKLTKLINSDPATLNKE